MGDSGEDSEVVMIVVGGAGYDDGSLTLLLLVRLLCFYLYLYFTFT